MLETSKATGSVDCRFARAALLKYLLHSLFKPFAATSAERSMVPSEELDSPQARPQRPLRQWFSLILGLVLLVLSLWSLGQTLEQTPPSEIWQSLRAIPSYAVGLALGLTVLNYGILTLYDVFSLRYARRRLSYAKAATVAIVGYALSNNIGFSVLSGAAVRYRFYGRWGLSNGDITRVILFSSLCFWVGLGAVGGGLFTLAPDWVSELLRLPVGLVRPLGGLGLGLIAAHLGWSALGEARSRWGAGRRSLRLGNWVLPAMPLELALGQVWVTLADWATVAAILYVLLPQAYLPSYPLFLGAYLLAKVATVMSNVPGGLGVFETVLLLALTWPDAAIPEFFGAMLAYRGLYYLLPLLVGIVLFCGCELESYRKKL